MQTEQDRAFQLKLKAMDQAEAKRVRDHEAAEAFKAREHETRMANMRVEESQHLVFIALVEAVGKN